MRHYRKAIDHVKQAIRANHSIYIYYISLSRFYSSLHDESTAMAVLDSALNYDRSLSDIWLAKGDIHKLSERYEDALKNYEIASAYDSKNWKGYYKQGVVLYYLGRLDEALSMLEKAFSFGPNQSGINHFLGLVFLSKENSQSALSFLTEASKLNPDDANIWFHLGQAQSHLSEIGKSRVSFEKSLEIRFPASRKREI